MTSPTTPLNTRNATPARRPARAPQKIVALLLLASIVVLLVSQDWSRRLEAAIAEFAIGAVLGVGSELSPVGTLLTVGAGSPMLFTLDVSFACSVVLLLIPLLLIAAALLFSGRAGLRRALPAVAISAIALLAINAARFVLIATMTLADGLDGYGWAHTVYGSFLVLGGLAAVLIFFVRVVSGPRQSTEQ